MDRSINQKLYQLATNKIYDILTAKTISQVRTTDYRWQGRSTDQMLDQQISIATDQKFNYQIKS